MHITGSRDLLRAERVESASEPARFAVGRPFRARVALALVLVAALGWLLSAPSAPAVIVVVSALIANVGWGGEVTGPLELSEE